MKRLKQLWSFMKGNRTLYALSVLAIGIATFVNFIWPLVLRTTIDSIIGKKDFEVNGWLQPFVNSILSLFGTKNYLARNLWICGLILVALTLIRGIFMYWKGRWSATSSESIAKNIRNRLYAHLQYLPYDYHQKAKTGDLVQRCTSDVETIRRFLAVQFVEVGSAIFMIVFALSFMIQMSIKMTIVSFALLPFIFVFTVIFFLKVKRAFQLSDESEGRLSAVLQENLTGVRVVRAFGRQKYETDKFDEKNVEYRDLTYKLIWFLAIYWGISDFLSLTQIGGILIFGTVWAAKGIISLGTLLAFSSYVGMLVWPIRQMGRVLTDMGKALVSVGRISEILEQPEEHLEDSETEFPRIEGNIEFKNVWFEYEKGKPILKDISFKVKAGQTVAILGTTGSGKSSLVHLLPRLYDYQKGSVKIDGKELKELGKRFIRENVGIVLQEPFLFSKTLKENIGIACRKFKDKEIFKAAEIASVHRVILNFEKGYETAVGERGITLSGGQKQRIAIARTVIRNNPILIFDDSLSSVDTETDAAIRKALKKNSGKATVFIISHRINTLAEADLILVLDKGRIVQQGTHSELIAQKGLYRRIWNIQNRLEEELKLEIEPVTISNEKKEEKKIG